MIKYVLLLITVGILNGANAQTLSKAADNAYIITRMVAKFHVQPRPVNKELSANLFDEVLRELDDDKIFFTQEDINRLQAFRLQLDDELLYRKTNFLQLLTDIYLQRLQQADTMIDNICKKPFNFTINEKFTAAEDSSWPANTAGLRVKLYKSIKMAELSELLSFQDDTTGVHAARKRKATDSLEVTVRRKIQSIFKRFIKKMLQTPGGLTGQIGNIYCESLSVCYDPHTAFFPPTEKENFESHLGSKPLQFGFQLNEDDDGGLTIGNLKPGSPAFRSGQLNKGDKIQAIQWDGKELIDVSDADIEELSGLLDASNHDKITLTVKKADGTSRQVSLRKEQAEDSNEDEKVKSFILKGSRSFGFISLPAFYTDWDDSQAGLSGCANDVAREILKLKRENISGIIIDLRYNGGGSVQEAVDMAGIFVDAGPVAQVKTREPKPFTLKDPNMGTIYDGPLLVLVNGYSASASEIFAGTLQDYNRAVIVGSPTYGKATAQVVLPMDTTISLDDDNQHKQADSYIKITTDKLYRVNGTTAQSTGVLPDVRLPDVLEANSHREASNNFVIPPSIIEPNKYYKPYAPLPIATLQAIGATDADTTAYFIALKTYISQYKSLLQPKDIPLRWEDALQERKREAAIMNSTPVAAFTARPPFTIVNHSFAEQRLHASEDLKEINEEQKLNLLKDAYVKVAYDLLMALAK